MASTSNKSVGTQSKYTWWHGLGLGFIWELPQDYGKVISISQQGQISSKRSTKSYFCCFATITFTWDVYDGLKLT